MLDDQKPLSHRERGRMGGLKTLERHGVEHFRRIQGLSWASQLARDPNANMRLGYAGLRSMDPAGYNGAWQNKDGSAKYQQQQIDEAGDR